MMLYVLFLASVTSYVMIHLNRNNFPDAETEQKELKECYLDFASNSPAEKVFTVLVVVFSLLNIVIEFSQMIRVRNERRAGVTLITFFADEGEVFPAVQPGGLAGLPSGHCICI